MGLWSAKVGYYLTFEDTEHLFGRGGLRRGSVRDGRNCHCADFIFNLRLRCGGGSGCVVRLEDGVGVLEFCVVCVLNISSRGGGGDNDMPPIYEEIDNYCVL